MAKRKKAHFPKRRPQEHHVPAGKGSSGSGWVHFALTAELRSDAHLGTGSGGGGIDALTARDRYGHPVIWASHLEGVLRDAARRLRGDTVAGDFFGRAGGARQRAVFTSLYTSEKPESHVWRSTARKAFANRAPDDDTLRVVEYVPKGTKLTGEVELPASDLPMLRRLLQEVDSLGGGRSSGAGRVTLALQDVSVTSVEVGGPSERLVVLLKNRDPLCITATATPDNLIPSLSFVPGRTLLGAVAAWLIGEDDRETASLLTSGRVAVSDALPLPQAPRRLDSVEVLPAPLSLQSAKPQGSADDVPWWAQAVLPTQRFDAFSATKTLKRPNDDLFVYRAAPAEPWVTFRPARCVRLRNGRPEPKQAEASLFAMEQIVEETHFLAEFRGAHEDMKRLAAKLAPVLEGRRWLRVGRAGAPVEVAQLVWQTAPAPEKTGERALLTLTSDLLVRDDELRWRTQLEEEELHAVLGSNDVQLGNSFQDSVMIHGFNGTSRLWCMPAAAVRRGSVFELSGAGLAKLAERAATGQWLGERTHEGFGRFRLDATLPGVTGDARASSAVAVATDVEEEAVAAKTKTWCNNHPSLASPAEDKQPKPSLSQWHDLVAELERRDANAIPRRLNPTTAGEKSWGAATAILEQLNEPTLNWAQRAQHARLFVRWLRVAMIPQRRREDEP